MKKITNLVLFLVLSTGAANAAIVILDQGFAANLNSNTITDANLGDLDFTGASKLVVTVGVKGSGLTPDNQVGTVTYNGTAMTLAAGSGPSPTVGDNSWGWSGIYYLDNPGSVGAGSIVVQEDGYSFGISALVLSGTQTGFGATASTTSAQSVSLTTTGAGSMVLAVNSDGGGVIAAAAPLTPIFYELDSSGHHASGYQIVATASTITPTFSGGARPSIVAAEFTAVPEPSAMLLGCLGLLALLRRRR